MLVVRILDISTLKLGERGPLSGDGDLSGDPYLGGNREKTEFELKTLSYTLDIFGWIFFS